MASTMDQALIIMLASFAATFGGPAQATVATLQIALGRSLGLLLVACAASVLASLAMAYLGAAFSSQLIGGQRGLIVCGALVLGAMELAWPRRVAAPKEPTRSLGAIALVLFVRQIFDAPRWIAFAGGAALASGAPAAWGGAIGAGAAMLFAWLLPRQFERHRLLRAVRLATALIAAFAAVLVAWIGLTYGA
jgi:hypothetical protein